METNNEIPNIDQITNQFKQDRLAYSHMLKEYLWIYKHYDMLKNDMKAENLKKRYFYSEPSYYDENGKINWEIIHRFIHLNFEMNLKEVYNMLNVNEIRLCCLLYYGVSSKMIAEILPYTQMSIRTITARIKRKAGFKDKNDMFEKLYRVKKNIK